VLVIPMAESPGQPVFRTMLAAIFIESARSMTLNMNERMLCQNTVYRIASDPTDTSDTCDAKPITNEKYRKSRYVGNSLRFSSEESSGKLSPPERPRCSA